MKYFVRYCIALVCAAFACFVFLYALRHTLFLGKKPLTVNFDLSPFSRPSLKLDNNFFEESLSPSQMTQIQVQKPPAAITARAYIVGNLRTGKIELATNEKTALPLASMSKLITAITAQDLIHAKEPVEITEEDMNLPGDSSNLLAHEKYLVPELMYPMLLSSSNIAAEAVSRAVNRQEFISSMTKYAQEIGMTSSNFADPSGLDGNDMASAQDMLYLARYIYLQHPDIYNITRIPFVTLATTTEHGFHQIVSTHPFVSDSRFVGGKTGRTPEAGETMLTVLNINKEPVAFIVLGSQYGTREWDTRQLIKKYEAKIGLDTN